MRRPGESQTLQLIPRSVLLGDFPTCLIDGYIHWLDTSTGELEFRPAESPWTPRSSNWRLYIRKPQQPGARRAVLQKRSQNNSRIRAIDIRSKTFGVLSSLLSSIESLAHIVVMYTTQTVEVSLPRFRLSFFVNANWELECRSISGYVVDNAQSCGTMFGLKSKLILCPSVESSEVPLMPRRVIIPRGEISFCTNGDFTSVSINTDAEQQVRWHEYTIDTDLGRLTSNTSLRCKLYQCYLHALTSHCLPDPLLGHTGTEEALYMLRSASCRSFQRLDVQEAQLLELISNLSPIRLYYSRHIQSMATVKWNDLPALSQHHDFFPAARSLLDHARTLETFYSPSTSFNTSSRNQTLMNRAACRNKLYYPSDLHSLGQSSSHDDVEYMSRDVSDLGNAEYVTFQTSWSLWNTQPLIDDTLPKLRDIIKSWDSLGPRSDEIISLRYSPYWLEFDAARDWLVICDLIRRSATLSLRNLRIELTFSLSSAAYSNSKYSNVIPYIVNHALVGSCRNLVIPPDSVYTLSDGITPDLTRVKDLVSKSARPLSSTLPHHLRRGITAQDVVSPLQVEHDEAVMNGSLVVAESMVHHWPNYQVVYVPERWFDRSDCHQHIKGYFRSISKNIQLWNHVLQLQGILQDIEGVSKSTPAIVPYMFSSQFITSPSKVFPCSLGDILVSQTNVPTLSPERAPVFQDYANPATAAAERIPLRTGLDSLEILIEELQDSGLPLLQLYGNELNDSHSELLGGNVTLFARGAVPSHKLLLLHHKECSRRKDELFCEISAALAPSQNVEETIRIAGIWPRITPRSILRQLARDRISTLPDQWKSVIVHYAISFLEYQQSLRLVELSSRQDYENLRQEIQAIGNNVLVESTPDWLLVQVRLFRATKKDYD